MKGVIIYLVGAVLLLPCCILICSDSIVGAMLGLAWGMFLWHSPKFSPTIRKFWLKFYKVGYKIIYSIF